VRINSYSWLLMKIASQTSWLRAIPAVIHLLVIQTNIKLWIFKESITLNFKVLTLLHLDSMAIMNKLILQWMFPVSVMLKIMIWIRLFNQQTLAMTKSTKSNRLWSVVKIKTSLFNNNHYNNKINQSLIINNIKMIILITIYQRHKMWTMLKFK